MARHFQRTSSVVAAVACGSCLVVCLAAQKAEISGAVSFEVAAVRHSPPDDKTIPMTRTLPGGRFLASRVPLRSLIGLAYGFRVKGSEKVLDELFNVSAKAPSDAVMSVRGPLGDMNRMLQALLEERFALRIHVEEDAQAALALRSIEGVVGQTRRGLNGKCADTQRTVKQGGPPLRCPSIQAINGQLRGLVDGFGDLAEFLSAEGRRTVIDETGLKGVYEIDMVYNPATFNSRFSETPEVAGLPSLSEALRRDLGLQLVSVRHFVPVVVVDHAQMPVEN